MRVRVNHSCNVLTGDDTKGYNPRREPQITLPQFRANLRIDEARKLAAELLEAASKAEEVMIVALGLPGVAEPVWKCGHCGGTVSGERPPKICPACDAGDPTSVLRAEWERKS